MRLGRKKAKNNGTFSVLIYSRYHDTSDTSYSFFILHFLVCTPYFIQALKSYASSPVVVCIEFVMYSPDVSVLWLHVFLSSGRSVVERARTYIQDHVV